MSTGFLDEHFERPRTRSTHPDTSRAAASRHRDEFLTRLRLTILRVYCRELRAMPDFELIPAVSELLPNITEQGIRGRRAELAARGYVRPAELVTMNTRNNACEVWEFTPPQERRAAKIAYLRQRVLANRAAIIYKQQQIDSDLGELRAEGEEI